MAAGCVLAATGVAGALPSPRDAVVRTQRLVGADGRTSGASTGELPIMPVRSVAVPRSAQVRVSVDRPYTYSLFTLTLPPHVGRFAAVYLPAFRQGAAVVANPGSSRGWSVWLPFGSGFGEPRLVPGRSYLLDVVVDRPGRILLPRELRVTSVRPHPLARAVTVTPLQVPLGASVASTGSVASDVRSMPLASMAVALNWDSPEPAVGATSADACPSNLPADSCQTGGDNIAFFEDTFESGGPHQWAEGSAFDTAQSAANIDGYGATAPTPFTAATLFVFGFDPGR